MATTRSIRIAGIVSLFILALIFLNGTNCYTQDNEFDRRINAYKQWKRTTARSDYTQSVEFDRLCELDVSFVPMMIERMKTDPDAAYIAKAVLKITKKQMTLEEAKAMPGPGLYTQKVAAYTMHWWQNRKRETTPEFTRRYTVYSELVKTRLARGERLVLWESQTYIEPNNHVLVENEINKITELGQAYRNIQYMGIDILPLIIQQLQAGDSSLYPMVVSLTDGQAAMPQSSRYDIHSERERVAYAIQWWKDNKEKWTIPE